MRLALQSIEYDIICSPTGIGLKSLREGIDNLIASLSLGLHFIVSP